MGFVPQITCRHCGKKYSALHSRCPNCGTRHVKQTSRTTATTASVRSGTAAAARADTNARWQFIFGCILIVAVLVAVIVLITASLGPKTTPEPVVTPPPPLEVTPTPTPTPDPTPTPEPTVPVTSVTITFLGRAVGEQFTQRIEWQPIQLSATVYPVEALEKTSVEWRSSNPEICMVDKTGLVTALSRGTCEIICECGGVAARVSVLVP